MKWLIMSLSLFGIVFFGGITEQDKKPLYFAPPNVIQHFSLGYRDFLADLMWLRFIQDADFCSFEKGKPVYRGDKKHCELGWSYRMVEAISELAPRFRTLYKLSSVLLSVFIGDKLGAEKILLKGLKHFPNDWKINFYAAYHYVVEVKKPELAARYAYQSAKNGGPYWMYSLAAKQYAEAEHLLLGETILNNLLNKNITDEQKVHVRRHIKEFRETYIKKSKKKQK